MKFKLVLSLMCLCIAVSHAQNSVKLSQFTAGVSIPVAIKHAEDLRLFVVEKAGIIKIIEPNGILNPTNFLNIRNRVNSTANERGLLGLAFHPEYKTNGYFYVNYTNTAGHTTISRFSRMGSDHNKADSLSEVILLVINQPFNNHNGGEVVFGPDGYLYIGMGDGGSGGDPQNHGQTTTSLLGKMLRIDVDTTVGYRIPPNNPHIGKTNYAPEIWAVGMRNPWRFSFDAVTGDMWIGDVGQDRWEEIDFQLASSKGGENYGWRCYEGTQAFNTNGCLPKSNYVDPIWEYVSDQAIEGCSVTGGFVYRGSLMPELYGQYIYADFCTGKIWALKRINNDSVVNKQIYKFANNQISAFGEDVTRELYLCAISQGRIYKLEALCTQPVVRAVSHDPSCDNSNDGFINLFIQNAPLYKIKWNTGDSTSTLANLGPGTYIYTVFKDSCSVTDTVILNPGITLSSCIEMPNVTAVCTGDSIKLEICNLFDSSAVYQWFANGSLVASGSTEYYAKSSGIFSSNFKLGSCVSSMSDSVSLIFWPLPQKSKLIRDRDSLVANSGFEKYIWFFNDTLLETTNRDRIKLIQEGKYTVIVEDSSGCRSLVSDPFIYVIGSSGDVFLIDDSYVVPNPVKDILTIVSHKLLLPEYQFNIYSIEGKRVMRGKYKTGKQIDVSSINVGTYILQLSSGGKNISSLQFIKM